MGINLGCQGHQIRLRVVHTESVSEDSVAPKDHLTEEDWRRSDSRLGTLYAVNTIGVA